MIDNTATTLYPGGILNTGFALSWAKDRVHDAQAGVARPAASRGRSSGSASGDKTCKANQALHPEAVDLLAKIERNRYYVPGGRRSAGAGHVRPQDPRPDVPRLPVDRRADRRPLPDARAAASPAPSRKWFTFTNGTHIDSLDPATFNRWFDFLELYVAGRAPRLPPGTAALAPLIYQTAHRRRRRRPAARPDPGGADATRRRGRRSRRSRAVRILFDNGAGSAPARRAPAFERSYPRWPLPGTARALVLPRGGRHARRRAATRRAGPTLHVEPARAARDRLLRRHRRGDERALDGDAVLRLARRTRPAPRSRTRPPR